MFQPTICQTPVTISQETIVLFSQVTGAACDPVTKVPSSDRQALTSLPHPQMSRGPPSLEKDPSLSTWAPSFQVPRPTKISGLTRVSAVYCDLPPQNPCGVHRCSPVANMGAQASGGTKTFCSQGSGGSVVSRDADPTGDTFHPGPHPTTHMFPQQLGRSPHNPGVLENFTYHHALRTSPRHKGGPFRLETRSQYLEDGAEFPLS